MVINSFKNFWENNLVWIIISIISVKNIFYNEFFLIVIFKEKLLWLETKMLLDLLRNLKFFYGFLGGLEFLWLLKLSIFSVFYLNLFFIVFRSMDFFLFFIFLRNFLLFKKFSGHQFLLGNLFIDKLSLEIVLLTVSFFKPKVSQNLVVRIFYFGSSWMKFRLLKNLMSFKKTCLRIHFNFYILTLIPLFSAFYFLQFLINV